MEMIHSEGHRVGTIWEPFGVPVLVPFSHMWFCPGCSGDGEREREREREREGGGGEVLYNTCTTTGLAVLSK